MNEFLLEGNKLAIWYMYYNAYMICLFTPYRLTVCIYKFSVQYFRVSTLLLLLEIIIMMLVTSLQLAQGGLIISLLMSDE